MNPVPESALAAEARARVLIDGQLTAAGWVVQDTKDLNLSAGQGVARREAIMAAGHGRADYLLYLDKRGSRSPSDLNHLRGDRGRD
jgi:type I restriction enzyme R subunit